MDAFEVSFDSDDVVLALEAAVATARRLQEDVAIMTDLAVVRLSEIDVPPLEIIRYVPDHFSYLPSSVHIH